MVVQWYDKRTEAVFKQYKENRAGKLLGAGGEFEFFQHARSLVTNWVDHSQIMIDLQSACQNGMVLRAGLLLVSCDNSVAFQWDILLLNTLGLLNNTIAYRGEKFVQPCGYEDLNQG